MVRGGRGLFCCKYNASTFARAHGVRRKNFRLDDTLGSRLKQRIGTASAIAAQPMLVTSSFNIVSRVMPSRLGGWDGDFICGILRGATTMVASLITNISP